MVLLLDLAAVDGPDVRRPLLVELGWLAGDAGDAQDLAHGELVPEGRRQRRTTPDDERLDLLGDAHGVGARRDLVGRSAGGDERHQLDGAAVGLVVRLVVADHVLHRLDLLLVGVVGGDGVGDVADDRVLLLREVEHDLDRLGRHARGGGAAVVSLERRVALGGEVVGHGDLPPFGVAALVPAHVDALLCGVREAQRVRDLAARGAACGGRAGAGLRRRASGRRAGSRSEIGAEASSARRTRRRRRRGAGLGRGGRGRGRDAGVGDRIVVVVTAAGGDEHDRDDGDERDDGADRPPPSQRPRAIAGSAVACAGWLHFGYPLVPERLMAALDVPR